LAAIIKALTQVLQNASLAACASTMSPTSTTAM
jgi:hypothetical protein